MSLILIKAFLSVWFDPLDKRIAHRARQDAAINNKPETKRVRTLRPEHWGFYE
jgi:hypothetical protein